MDGRNMMVFSDNPQALVGDIELPLGIAGFLNRLAYTDVVKGFFGYLHADNACLCGWN